MKIVQVGLVLLAAVCASAWGVDSLVAVPYRLVNVVPTTVNGQAGQRITLATGRTGEVCYLLLNDKSAQDGRIESINGSNRDQGFSCVREGVVFGLVGSNYFNGNVKGSSIEIKARLFSEHGQALDVYTSQPVRISF